MANRTLRFVKQQAKNFVWGINDTMNAPARAVWQIATRLTPKWTKANDLARSFRNTAYWVTEMWQDHDSAAYAAWRLAPIVWASVLSPASAIMAPESIAAAAWPAYVGLANYASPKIGDTTDPNPKEWKRISL